MRNPSPYMITVRPAAVGFVGTVKHRPGSGILDSSSMTWRPTLKMLVAALTRKRLRREAADARKAQERVVD